MKQIRELWALDEIMQEIAETIQVFEKKRTAFASILHPIRRDLNLSAGLPIADQLLAEGKLAVSVKPTELSGLRVCGVDGGLLKRGLRGIDLVVTRANATIFEYTPNGRVLAEYFPQQVVPPIVKAELNPISRRESEVNASLERTKAELQLALQVLDQYPIELLLLDGSLRPHISDRPSANSNLAIKYQEIRDLYTRLYESAESKGTLLAGVVKDSRSTRFMRLLGELLPHLIQRYSKLSPLLKMDYRSILKGSYDTDFFYRILEVGERSGIFYLKANQSTKTEDDNNESKSSSKNIVGFYMQTAKFDFPFRIEVFTGSYDPIAIISKVSAMLLPMSSDNQEFALPTVLIDADSQARLIEKDLDFLFSQLANRLGYPQSLLKLRRERMPFH